MPDWERGDTYGIDLPSHPAVLREGGPEFLTRAFRASGAIGPDNAVTAITRFDEWAIGGTGPKVLMSVAYARDEPGLPHDMFVKFSRSFDKGRDTGRFYLGPEVRLANFSRHPAFPIPVPRPVYADFHAESGTGVLISERIPYGQGTIEPHRDKCTDHLLADPFGHHRVMQATLARLPAAHKAGRFGNAVEAAFPLDMSEHLDFRIRFNQEQMAGRVGRLADFIEAYPHLFPARVTDSAFLDRFRADAPLVIPHEGAIRRELYSRPERIALCHWNGQLDNGWFWREPDGTLKCGLIDWGAVGQMHLAQTFWGSINGSEVEMVDEHLDHLIDVFLDTFAENGGARIPRGEFQRDLAHHVIVSSLRSLLSSPPLILREVPDPASVPDRYAPIFAVNETARVQLKVTIGFLNLWHRYDLGSILRSGVFAAA